MRAFKKLYLIVIFWGVFSKLQAQDTVHFRQTKTYQVVNITQIDEKQVSYRILPFNADTNIYYFDAKTIEYIVMHSGEAYEFPDNQTGINYNFYNQTRHAVKFKLISPLLNHLAFSYELLVRNKQSLEFGLIIPGIGEGFEYEYVRGAIVRVGYKFITTPIMSKYRHQFHGEYFKPEIILGSYGRSNNQNRPVLGVHKYTFAAVMASFGYQWVIAKKVVIDWGAGLGYIVRGNYNFTKKHDLQYHYAFVGGANDFPLIVNFNFKLGLIIGKSSQ